MFTGIIEEVGLIKSINKTNNLMELTIQCEKVLEGTKYGDSIATNGVCLTVTELSSNYFKAQLMKESLLKTNFSSYSLNDKVNLERALQANSRLDGHIVQGHVDGVGLIKQIINENNNLEIIIQTSEDILKYIIEKGSVCLDGISLTVSEVTREWFKVSIIPTTLKETALINKKKGDYLNIETDILGRYIYKMFNKNEENSKKSNITRNFLLENGF